MDGNQRTARLLLGSRFLTHSGDQAWDFAVPLALISIFPQSLNVVALYYLLVRLGHVIFVAKVCSKMDTCPRLLGVKIGIWMQTLGVIVGAAMILSLSVCAPKQMLWTNPLCLTLFATVVVAGLVSSLGSTMLDIAVSQDWMPLVIPKAELTRVNSRLKQIDLGTELGAPVIAGTIMALSPPTAPLSGFLLIALWNVSSFIPELWLLKKVFRLKGELSQRVSVLPVQTQSLVQKILGGWRDFLGQPAAPAMIAYALVWLTVLSPHGVLLTAWMRAEWQMPETVLGLFRGLGAVFGLMATFIFPRLLRKMALLKATRWLVVFEACCLVGAGFAFSFGREEAVWFLSFVLLSRIGLYGFSLGEMEIRQSSIPVEVKGKINGFANALTSMATLGVYGAGSLLSETSDFPLLVYGSVAFVMVGAVTFSIWSVAAARQGGNIARI